MKGAGAVLQVTSFERKAVCLNRSGLKAIGIIATTRRKMCGIWQQGIRSMPTGQILRWLHMIKTFHWGMLLLVCSEASPLPLTSIGGHTAYVRYELFGLKPVRTRLKSKTLGAKAGAKMDTGCFVVRNPFPTERWLFAECEQ